MLCLRTKEKTPKRNVCFQAANGKSQNARKKIKILDAWKRRKDADKKAVARLERVELPTL